MMRILRVFIAFIITFETLFAGGVSGGGPKVQMPEVPQGTYGQYVNPFTGTGGIPWMCGMLSPAASAPFGCVRLGPDTCFAGGFSKVKTNTSGYYYEFGHMLGFSLSRLSGTGARDYGMFRVTPTLCGFEKPAALAFSHRNETASPGYYAVYLPGAAAICEMTATAHVGLQRYTFRTAKSAGLVLDAATCLGEDPVENAAVQIDPSGNSLTAQATLFGTFSGRYGGLPVFLYAEWDSAAQAKLADDGASVLLDFGSIQNRSVTLKTAVSFVSAANAKENLRTEAGEKDFDAVKAQTAAEWESRLSTIDINADKNTKTVFYTALYHTMLMPTDYTDANGDYKGFDGETHKAEGFTYRTDMSLWDTCRNAHSLYTLIAPDVQRDSLNSLLCMAEQGGSMPRWPSGNGYSGSMFGDPANIVFAESCLKGVPFDLAKAYSYIKQSAEGTDPKKMREDAALYNEYGYLPDDLARRYSVSQTLEYAWEDAAAATLADALGYEEDAALFKARSMNYKNLWDDTTAYFRPKNSDGSWGDLRPHLISFIDDILGTEMVKAYCEGSARQWRWSALNDIDGMIGLFGSKETFVKELEAFMKDAAPTRGAFNPGSGYWIGNQHDIHCAYLFNNAGRPDLTQKWVRWTLKNRFSADVDGLDGNDDGGTLSAWYVFSALGFYPIAGTDRYWIGSPCVTAAEIAVAPGKTLKVTVNNQSDRNIYVKSVSLNGEPIAEPFLTHAQLAEGGELVFTMTN